MAGEAVPFRILLVDDEPAVRIPLVRLLARVGYEVAEAKTGRGALELLREARFDLLITDLKLDPDMGGLELIVQARAMFPQLKVILMSGESLDRMVELAGTFALGHHIPLVKPFTTDMLLDTVARMLAREDRGQAQG